MPDQSVPGSADAQPEGEVLFATIAAGGGHVATANAMAEALSSQSDGRLRTRVSDVMAEYGAAGLDRRHKRAWRRMLAQPNLVRVGQRLTDAVPALTRGVHYALLDGFAKQVSARLNSEAPRLIVVNHGWLATAFTRAKTRFGLEAPVAIYATEPFDASALWSTPKAEVVLAPSAAARSDLIDLGVPAPRVLVAGYPVARRFIEAPTQERARAELGLSAAFTCLLSLGAEGVADGDAARAALDLAAAGVEVIAVCGRNQELRARLEEETERLAPPTSGAGRVHVKGFVENMELLIAASDLVAGKAGPASTMEALAVGRPVVAASYAGLNERAVVRFLEAFALGGYSAGFRALPTTVVAWRDDPQRLQAARQAASQLGFGDALNGIARFLLAMAAGRDHAAQELLPGPFAEVTRRRLQWHDGAGPATAERRQDDDH